MLEQYVEIKHVPTEKLATNFVSMLVLADGNLEAYQNLTEILIRALRGEQFENWPKD